MQEVIIIQGVIDVLLLALLAIMQNKVHKHQAALKWFADHVRIDPRSQIAPMPEDLQRLVNKLTDGPDDE